MKRRPAPKHRAPRTAPRGAARAATLLTAAALVVPVLTAAPSSAAPSAGSLAANPAASGFRAHELTVTRYVTTGANIRSGPSTGYRIVGYATGGTKVTGTWASNGWLKTGSGRYIAGSRLSSYSSSSTSTASDSGSGLSSDRIVAEATKYLGIMYVWGGETPAGFDCSGYTQYVFSRLGVSLPRTVSGQRSASSYVSTPRPGDLVFWGTYHVAIYAGNGYIYDSGKPGLPVQKRKMFSGVTSFGRVNG